MNELMFYVCAGLFVILAPLCCVIHRVAPQALRYRQIASISILLGWFLIFLGAVFAELGQSRNEFKLLAGFLGWMPAMASAFLWLLLFWIGHRIAGRPWPISSPDDPAPKPRRRS